MTSSVDVIGGRPGCPTSLAIGAIETPETVFDQPVVPVRKKSQAST